MAISVKNLINTFNTHSCSTESHHNESALARRQPCVANTSTTPSRKNLGPKPVVSPKPKQLTELKGVIGKPAVPPKPAVSPRHAISTAPADQLKTARKEETKKPDARPAESSTTLSSKKLNYLGDALEKGVGHLLYAEDIKSALQKYSAKYNIIMEFNGFFEKVDSYERVYSSLADSFYETNTFGTARDINYVAYVFDNGTTKALEKFITKDELYALADKYTNDQDLSNVLADIDGVKEIVEKLHYDYFGKKFSRNLSHAEAIDELNELARKAAGKPAGYLYMRGRQQTTDHTEGVIVDRNKVQYSVVPYLSSVCCDFTAAGKEKDENFEFYKSDVNIFITGEKVPEFYPLASGTECASLSLATLKEYLKNDAKQWYDYTLKVDFGNGHKFLLPSPQVLRYSQGGGYPEMVAAMVGGGKINNEVSYNGKLYSVETLAGLLDKGATITNQHGDKLDQAGLEEFCAHWNLAYGPSMAKREKMTAEVKGKTRNVFLSYKSHEYWRQSSGAGEEKASH